MLGICRPAISTFTITFVRRLSRTRLNVLPLRCAQTSVMTDSLGSKPLLDAQSFGGDLLNRSVGDRRDEKFVETAYRSSTSLLITGRSVLAKRRDGVNTNSPQSTELCWLSPHDLQDYGIQAQTDSQTTVAGAWLPVYAARSAYQHSRYLMYSMLKQAVSLDTDQEKGCLVPYLLGQTQQEQWSFALDASAYGNQEQLQQVAKQKGVPNACF